MKLFDRFKRVSTTDVCVLVSEVWIHFGRPFFVYEGLMVSCFLFGREKVYLFDEDSYFWVFVRSLKLLEG